MAPLLIYGARAGANPRPRPLVEASSTTCSATCGETEKKRAPPCSLAIETGASATGSQLVSDRGDAPRRDRRHGYTVAGQRDPPAGRLRSALQPSAVMPLHKTVSSPSSPTSKLQDGAPAVAAKPLTCCPMTVNVIGPAARSTTSTIWAAMVFTGSEVRITFRPGPAPRWC